ncbi:Uncharacterized protein OBRU01_13703 [Operophtera brumata]|uniref:Uncharacterized protein n=1 Tax=Operophtera brumata TaxID=104452 RepID=A0A0L7L7I5_OPEBR|nr:Uncharacterized protein OBRU01_13703 [Operophtera brumata]
MSGIPDNAPQHCPGTQSDDAGKASACAGCPNQNICASELIRDRLSNVKHKILILSGKGGVGKSTVTSLLGHALAATSPDVNPRVLGEQVHNSGSGWSPVVSTRYPPYSSHQHRYLHAEPAARARRAWRTSAQLRLGVVSRRTSDEHLSSVQYLSAAGLTGALVVTTPQEAALLDVRKELQFCSKVGVRVLGVIENMSVFVCPNCKKSCPPVNIAPVEMKQVLVFVQ